LISRIPFLQTDEELQFFFDPSGFGLLSASENASDETLPAFAMMHEDHFNEITIAFCDPVLTGREGFFVYRFTDNALLKIHQSLYNLSSGQIEEVLAGYAVSDILKAEMAVVQYLERGSQTMAFLTFNTEGNFYLTADQIDLAKDIKARCQFSVLYETSIGVSLSEARYGFPNASNEQMRIVQIVNDSILKYLMIETLNSDKAVEFCQAVTAGTVPQFYKSESVPTKKNETIEHLVADSVLEFISVGFSVVGIFHFDDECLRYLRGAKRELVKKGYTNVKVGESETNRHINHAKSKRISIRDEESIEKATQNLRSARAQGEVSGQPFTIASTFSAPAQFYFYIICAWWSFQPYI
jgi:hypothetical protein